MVEKPNDELVKVTKAMLLLQLRAISEPEEQPKLEVVLSRAGFAAPEIAVLLGKDAGAVRKTLERARKAA